MRVTGKRLALVGAVFVLLMSFLVPSAQADVKPVIHLSQTDASTVSVTIDNFQTNTTFTVVGTYAGTSGTASAATDSTGWGLAQFGLPSNSSGTFSVVVTGGNATRSASLKLGQPNYIRTVKLSGTTTTLKSTPTTAKPVSTTAVTVKATSGTYGVYGLPIDRDPNAYAQAASQIASASSSDKALIAKITNNPTATWFSDDTDLTNKVTTRVSGAAQRNAVPVLVMYDIPRRDCGNYSAGGAADAAGYQKYVNDFVAGLGSHKAIVIVEPDGLPLMTCLSTEEQNTRMSLEKYAVDKVSAQGSWTYIDAGTDVYQPISVMVPRLKLSGVAEATGFALNISMFRTNAELVPYAQTLSSQTGGKHFVIDTSRNGVAASPTDYSWCNPPNRGLGQKPGVVTNVTGQDANLWIKPPGESDGSCDGAPGPGTWYQSYAIGLAKNAAF